jgi:ATP-dependent Clp protease ATP-binding subunit ClpB
MIPLDPTRRGPLADKLIAGLRERVVGQPEAITAVADALQLHEAGMNAPGRPICNLLFLGPTGCGKTRVVEATAECFVGNPRAVIKIDCGEFQHSHEVAKLIGSPPGYLGHRETSPRLAQQVIDQHYTADCRIGLMLFDEIEKASDALWNILLGILDKGVCTMGDNRVTDFSRAMIFMTGNVGSAEMASLQATPFAFVRQQDRIGKTGTTERVGLQAARRKFTPEFINRIDRIVVFKALGPSELAAILELELRAVGARLAATNRQFSFVVSDAARRHLLEQGTDARYGARHLKRAIERLVVQPLACLIASEQVGAGDRVRLDHVAGAGAFTFDRECEALVVRAA